VSRPSYFVPCFLVLLGVNRSLAAVEPVVEIAPDPAAIQLTGANDRYFLLIQGKTAGGRVVDLTHDAKYSSANPQVATVSS
jgi:hypothetical protein